MKDKYGSASLYMLQPQALFNFAAQTLEFASQTLGYRDPSPSYTEDEVYSSSINCKKDETRDEESGLVCYGLNEVAEHDTMDDCWIVLYDKVFDITKFLQEHPGGDDVLMEHAGRDATLAFRGVGHSLSALQALNTYLVGILKKDERIYTGEGPCQWSTL